MVTWKLRSILKGTPGAERIIGGDDLPEDENLVGADEVQARPPGLNLSTSSTDHPFSKI